MDFARGLKLNSRHPLRMPPTPILPASGNGEGSLSDATRSALLLLEPDELAPIIYMIASKWELGERLSNSLVAESSETEALQLTTAQRLASIGVERMISLLENSGDKRIRYFGPKILTAIADTLADDTFHQVLRYLKNAEPTAHVLNEKVEAFAVVHSDENGDLARHFRHKKFRLEFAAFQRQLTNLYSNERFWFNPSINLARTVALFLDQKERREYTAGVLPAAAQHLLLSWPGSVIRKIEDLDQVKSFFTDREDIGHGRSRETLLKRFAERLAQAQQLIAPFHVPLTEPEHVEALAKTMTRSDDDSYYQQRLHDYRNPEVIALWHYVIEDKQILKNSSTDRIQYLLYEFLRKYVRRLENIFQSSDDEVPPSPSYRKSDPAFPYLDAAKTVERLLNRFHSSLSSVRAVDLDYLESAHLSIEAMKALLNDQTFNDRLDSLIKTYPALKRQRSIAIILQIIAALRSEHYDDLIELNRVLRSLQPEQVKEGSTELLPQLDANNPAEWIHLIDVAQRFDGIIIRSDMRGGRGPLPYRRFPEFKRLRDSAEEEGRDPKHLPSEIAVVTAALKLPDAGLLHQALRHWNLLPMFLDDYLQLLCLMDLPAEDPSAGPVDQKRKPSRREILLDPNAPVAAERIARIYGLPDQVNLKKEGKADFLETGLFLVVNRDVLEEHAETVLEYFPITLLPRENRTSALNVVIEDSRLEDIALFKKFADMAAGKLEMSKYAIGAFTLSEQDLAAVIARLASDPEDRRRNHYRTLVRSSKFRETVAKRTISMKTADGTEEWSTDSGIFDSVLELNHDVERAAFRLAYGYDIPRSAIDSE